MSKKAFKVLTYPNSVLEKPAEIVTDISDDLIIKIDRMWETLYKYRGIGLAAPQVGLSKRVVVIDLGYVDEKEAEKNSITKCLMINPIIIDSSEETTVYEEGCLSIPGVHINVNRPESVTVKFYDEQMKEQIQSFTGLMAVCAQHEIDHLEGTLMIDYVDLKERDFIVGKSLSYKKQRYK